MSENTEKNFDLRSSILSLLGDKVISSSLFINQLQIEIFHKDINDVLAKLHMNSIINFDQLVDITAVDYPEKKLRFEVIYLLLSTDLNQRLMIKTKIGEGDYLPTSVNIFKSANWSEREIWDMFGIFFSDHPDLRRILTDYGFEGHPLRKDFPLTGHTEVRYSEDQKKVVNEPVKLEQNYRNFDYESPWEGTKYIKDQTENNDKKN